METLRRSVHFSLIRVIVHDDAIGISRQKVPDLDFEITEVLLGPLDFRSPRIRGSGHG